MEQAGESWCLGMTYTTNVPLHAKRTLALKVGQGMTAHSDFVLKLRLN